ncbi:MAG: hypothetical protein Crog4KO_08990 [Crocinitomicaceae bacterium]
MTECTKHTQHGGVGGSVYTKVRGDIAPENFVTQSLPFNPNGPDSSPTHLYNLGASAFGKCGISGSYTDISDQNGWNAIIGLDVSIGTGSPGPSLSTGPANSVMLLDREEEVNKIRILTMRVSRISTWIFAFLFLITFLGTIIYFAFSGSKRGREFYESEFKKEVLLIERQNKHDCIKFKDGTELKFSIDFNDLRMKPFYGKHYDEFIFPGDSILKEKDQNWLTIKPKNGEPFEIFF